MHNRALRNDATHQYNLNFFFIGFGFPPYFTAILKPTKKTEYVLLDDILWRYTYYVDDKG